VFVALAACDSRGFKKCYPARGKVLFNGEPAAGAVVMFHPLDNPSPRAIKSRGVVNPDGTYSMYTYNENDGVPPGNYAVTVTNFPQSGGDNRLPGRYAEASTTELRARIEAGANEMPTFELIP
jgi:hypothetical protein